MIDNELYIKAINEKGGKIKLKSDIYFFTTIYCFDGISEKDSSKIVIQLYGSISKKIIIENGKDKIKPAKNKDFKWHNYYIQKKELMPPMKFLWKLQKHYFGVCENGKCKM